MATSLNNGFPLPSQSCYRSKCCAGSKSKHKNTITGTVQWKKADVYKSFRGCTKIHTGVLIQWEQQTPECILHEGKKPKAQGHVVCRTDGLSTRCQPPQIFTTDIMFNNFHYKLQLVWILCLILILVWVRFMFIKREDGTLFMDTVKCSCLLDLSTNVFYWSMSFLTYLAVTFHKMLFQKYVSWTNKYKITQSGTWSPHKNMATSISIKMGVKMRNGKTDKTKCSQTDFHMLFF